jgi:hypothetical protein
MWARRRDGGGPGRRIPQPAIPRRLMRQSSMASCARCYQAQERFFLRVRVWWRFDMRVPATPDVHVVTRFM